MIPAIFFAMAACVSLTPKKETPKPDIQKYEADVFFETITMTGLSFSHDESQLLVSSDASGVFNAYAVPIDTSPMRQLTHSSSSSIFIKSYFPQDDRIIYSADNHGNERHHIFIQEENGIVQDLTPGSNTSAKFLGFNKDKNAFWITTNERDPKVFDLYRYDTNGYHRKLIFENRGEYEIVDISPDGRFLALMKTLSNTDRDIFLWDAKSPAEPPRSMSLQPGEIKHGVFAFTPDSRKLIFSTNEHSEYDQAWCMDLSSQKTRPIVQTDWDVWFVSFSDNGRYRVTGINRQARTEVIITDQLDKQGKIEIKGLPPGDISQVTFSASASKMAFYLSDDTSPANLYIVDLKTKKPRKLTNNLNPKIDPSHLVSGHDIRYQSFDGLEIPAILYRPYNASRTNPAPGIIYVHGGPGGQCRHGYIPSIQHLVNHGYTVLAVNNRGSTGYGKTFFHLDDKRHGDVDLKDCIWGRRYMEGLDWIAGEKIAILGGSYGGFMVAAALAFEPEAFDVGIDIFGVTNWVRTLKNIPSWWHAFRKSFYDELGDPSIDEERLQKISPLFHAKNIVKPLLVVQGANDPRVLQSESDEIVEAVRKNGVPVEYVLFPDEGHGFLKRANRIKASQSYLRFLDNHLKNKKEKSKHNS